MQEKKGHISVCICTYKRPEQLRCLLSILNDLETDDLFEYSVIVADNDAACSAYPVMKEASFSRDYPIYYELEPVQNIALARNRSLKKAEGDYVAFIDDDEIPELDWLLQHYMALNFFNAPISLGPVLPKYIGQPNKWVIDGKFCERPRYKTGVVLNWKETRTGNVLMRRDIIADDPCPFDPQYGAGGEDVNFFKKLSDNLYCPIWCDESIVWESVPPERTKLTFFMRRSYNRGNLNSIAIKKRNPIYFSARLIRSFLTITIFTALFPLAFLIKFHKGANYIIRLSFHLGLITGLTGIDTLKTHHI